MKLVVQLQLKPTPEQAQSLLRTMRAFNAAADHAASVGFAAQKYTLPAIQKLCYRELRERFGVSAQMAVRAIGKAADCFARDKNKQPTFRPLGAVVYDDRIMSRKGADRLSLLTLDGRVIVPFVCGERQRQMLASVKGQADLMYRGGKFFLLWTANAPDVPERVVSDVLGVDLGIVNIAADSDGKTYSGKDVDACRERYAKRRAALNRVGTKSARRRLSKIRKRESNFRRNENHVIAKKLVASAEGTGRGIALEDLKGIRDRITVSRTQRARHSGWAFFQLRAFIAYKAKLVGVPVVAVNPRDTSRTCNECGHCEKANRKSQSEFVCRRCDHTAPADTNAARNIRAKALVIAPKVGAVAVAGVGGEASDFRPLQKVQRN